MFQAIQIVYWLALSVWFGALFFVVVAAPIVFRTVRDADPTLPKVLSVNLEGQHSTLLAGTIMGDLLHVLVRVQLACAAALLLIIILQWFKTDIANVLPPILRSAAYVAAAALLIYYWRVVGPRALKYRQEYLDNADNPDVANPALDQFDHYTREGDTVLLILLALVLFMILFSADIRPNAISFSITR
jgi:hypothetical protein